MKRKIYLASSWRNPYQPEVLAALRAEGHEVYDFRNPAPGQSGFAWSQMDPEWKNWNLRQYVHMIENSPVAEKGFGFDKDALNWCDTCVLLLPCGRSAHLEAGYAAGQGKDVLVYLHQDQFEPELMYLLCQGFVTNTEEMKIALRQERGRLTTIGFSDKQTKIDV
jgi:nucleoside 2-deoxyribosyltransferase